MKCQTCNENEATGPKIVGYVPQGSSVKAIKTLLMCDECKEKYDKGELAINFHGSE